MSDWQTKATGRLALADGSGAAFSEGPQFSTERKVQGGFVFALACVALVGVLSYQSVVRFAQNEAWVRHSDEVIGRLQSLLTALTDAETAQRGYLITADEGYLQPYRQALQDTDTDYQSLRVLTADNPEQQRRLARLQPSLTQRLGALRMVLEIRRTETFEVVQRAVLSNENRRVQEEMRRVIDEMTSAERQLLAQREGLTQRSNWLTQATILCGGGLAFLFVALALIAIRRDFAGRSRAELALRAAKEELELRVRQRTAELEQSTESLRNSEKRLRAYVSATSDVIYRMSPDWAEMRQLQGQEFLADTENSNHGWLDKYIYPDDQTHVMEVIHEAVRGKTPFQLEHRVRRADGTVGWTFSRAIPLLGPQGEISEWFGAASDVTERKQAQLKLQAQLARLSLLSQITRAIGERQDVRSIFQVVIRTLEADLPTDFCCICLYDPAEQQLTVSSVGMESASLALELALPERARIDIDQNGLSRCVRGQLVYEPHLRGLPHAFPQRLSQGGLCAMVAAPLVVESHVFGVLIAARREAASFSSGECEFLRQVSEHVALASHQAQLHQALQRAYDDLRQTQHAIMQQERLLALGKMASGIAHDINNAISPASLYLESLLERATDILPQTRNYLTIIQRAIDDVAQTVARMREFYRPRDALQKLLPVDLNRLILQVLDLTRVRWGDMAQQRGTVIEVTTELAPSLPAVAGIESELRDALTNLIFNAIDAMPTGGRLQVRTRMARVPNASYTAGASTRATIQLQVQDTGIGMNEDTRARCLEPFFTTKGARGTGLGLAMVFGAIQRHDAEIDIQSVLGGGTTITLEFPVPAIQAGDSPVLPHARVLTPLRILIIDDDPLILKSLRDILEGDGHHVTAAEGGQAGIDQFLAAKRADELYQVVITDLGMPHVDGRKVAATIRSAAPDTLIVLLTGWGQRLMEQGDAPAQVDRVLTKPPRLREVREALALYLDASG